MNFEDYLQAKKIDAAGFSEAEPELFLLWKMDFSQMHPNSFTMQKLNLINSIRRKYHTQGVPGRKPEIESTLQSKVVTTPGKPVIRPKPKF